MSWDYGVASVVHWRVKKGEVTMIKIFLIII